MSRSISRRGLLAGLACTACARSLKNFPFDPEGIPLQGIEVTYFSVGCVRIRFGERAILTDPFFSHLPFLQVAFGNTISDPEQYTPYLKEVEGVDAVLVGHSHYDHTLDLAVVAPHLAPNAKIFGSQTLAHTYATSSLERSIVPVNRQLASPESLGEWIDLPEQHMRILPIRSDHPTQYLFIHLFTEKLSHDRSSPPLHAGDFQEGITIAYLVDFLDPVSREIQARTYIQTSSTGYPAGYFPASILEEHPVDMAVLAMDCANIKSEKKKSIIDFLQPSAVLFCHWEDFFRPKSQEPKEIVRVDLHKLRTALPSTSDRRYIFPYWDRSYYVPISQREEPE